MFLGPRSRFFVLLFGLAALVGATFGRVVRFEFVRWDDDLNITRNPLLTEPWSWELFGKLFRSDHALRFKPLHWLFERVVYQVAGLDPAAWHAAGLALHIAVALLFCAVLRRGLTMATGQGRGATIDEAAIDLAAFGGAAVWAVHPLRAEVAAWATASTYSFTALGLLASFHCYLRGADEPRAPSRRRWRVAAWLFAVAAYASYPVSLGYVFLLVAADQWLLPRRRNEADGRDENAGARLARYGAFLLPALAAAGATIWSRYAEPGIFAGAPDLQAVGVPLRVATALASLVYLGWKFAWPTELTPNLAPLALDPATQLAIATLAVVGLALLTVAWRWRARWPVLAFVVLGFGAVALPCLGLTERPTWPVDRYAYIAHLILAGGVAGVLVAAWHGSRSRGRAALGAVLLLVTVAAVAAVRQAGIWRDTRTLFGHFEQDARFAANPRQQAHVYVIWAHDEASRGEPARAAEKFNRAQQIYFAAMQAAVGRADYANALRWLADYARHFDVSPVLRREKGTWLLRLGQRAEAVAELKRALADAPDDVRAAALLAEAEAGAPGARPTP